MTDRVEVPVHEYLRHEGVRMYQTLGAMKVGVITPEAALAEVLDSYSTILSLLAQQQLERDTRGNG